MFCKVEMLYFQKLTIVINFELSLVSYNFDYNRLWSVKKGELMKKSLIVASLLLVGSSALVAGDMDNSWFVGGEFGAQNIKVKDSGEILGVPFSEKDTVNATYEAIKFGKYFEYGRVSASLSKQNEKDDLSSYSLGLGYDYMFKNKSEFTPFLGLNASYTKAKIDDAELALMGVDKPKGFNYGVQAGIVYAASKNVELEMGARYMISNVKDTFSSTAPAVSLKIESENIIQYYVGLNYKF